MPRVHSRPAFFSMSQPLQTSAADSTAFKHDARERVSNLLRQKNLKEETIAALTQDASIRQYFRVGWDNEQTAIVAAYAEPFDPELHPYLDVTNFFLKANLPVPQIFFVDGAAGLIAQEDLGDRQLFGALRTATPVEADQLLAQAIELLADVQAATGQAFALDSIACRLAFDEAKLNWELNYFLEHFFQSLRGEQLARHDLAELKTELNDVAAELSARPRVLCHRDYHASNLMIDTSERMRIVDHQDARMGPVTYDLVSLLCDRQATPPAIEGLGAKQQLFIEARVRRGLDSLDHEDFAREFDLMTIQRGLKAVGTFSFQTARMNRGATYAAHIRPTLLTVREAAVRLARFPKLREMIGSRLESI